MSAVRRGFDVAQAPHRAGAADATAPILAVEIVAARARAVSGRRVRAAQLLERRERVVVPARVAERHRERAPRSAAGVAPPPAPCRPPPFLASLFLPLLASPAQRFFELFTWAAFLAAAPAFTARPEPRDLPMRRR